MKILLAMQEGYPWLVELIFIVIIMLSLMLCLNSKQYMKKDCDFSRPATLQHVIKVLKVMDSEIEKKKEYKLASHSLNLNIFDCHIFIDKMQLILEGYVILSSWKLYLLFVLDNQYHQKKI